LQKLDETYLNIPYKLTIKKNGIQISEIVIESVMNGPKIVIIESAMNDKNFIYYF